jgi:hypothetical protein
MVSVISVPRIGQHFSEGQFDIIAWNWMTPTPHMLVFDNPRALGHDMSFVHRSQGFAQPLNAFWLGVLVRCS